MKTGRRNESWANAGTARRAVTDGGSKGKVSPDVDVAAGLGGSGRVTGSRVVARLDSDALQETSTIAVISDAATNLTGLIARLYGPGHPAQTCDAGRQRGAVVPHAVQGATERLLRRRPPLRRITEMPLTRRRG